MGYCAFQQHRLYICHRREGLLRLPFHHIHHVARLDALAGGDRVATYHIPSNHRPCNAATIRHKYRFGQRLRKDVAIRSTRYGSTGSARGVLVYVQFRV